MDQVTPLDIASTFFGVLGTLLLACRSKWAGWGFVAYLVSNMGWLVYSLNHGAWALMGQYTVFSVVSLYGVWKWLIQSDTTTAVTNHQSVSKT